MTNLVLNVLNKYDLLNKGNKDLYIKHAILISNFIDNNKQKMTLELLADNVQFSFINYSHTCYDIITCTNIAAEIIKIMEG